MSLQSTTENAFLSCKLASIILIKKQTVKLFSFIYQLFLQYDILCMISTLIHHLSFVD